MASESVRVRQRPIRIGWCIRNNNWTTFGRRCVRLILCGRAVQSADPVGVVCAERLIRRFRVDVLLNVTDDPEIAGLMKGFGHLPWRCMNLGCFPAHSVKWRQTSLTCASLQKIADDVRREHLRHSDDSPMGARDNPFALVHCSSDDPLADFFLATFGAIHSRREQPDYAVSCASARCLQSIG